MQNVWGGVDDVDWGGLTAAWLHDPPDAAVDRPGHDRRARAWREAVLGAMAAQGRAVRDSLVPPDKLSPAVECLPLPRLRAENAEEVGVDARGCLHVAHPLSGRPARIDVRALQEADPATRLAPGFIDPHSARSTFMRVWRLLPEMPVGPVRLGELPANPSIPDHTVADHADIRAALWAASQVHGWGLLAVSIGPVQSFIAQARTVRDLWSGSALLSRLAFAGLLPLIERLGPTAIVFPALRGTPQMDLWLKRTGIAPELNPAPESRLAPSLPHRFLAVVPWGEGGALANALAGACVAAIRAEWAELGRQVRRGLATRLDSLYAGWDADWEAQMATFPEVHAVTIGESEMTADRLGSLLGVSRPQELSAGLIAADRLGRMLPPGASDGQSRPPIMWRALVEVAGRMLDAARLLRTVPAPRAHSGLSAPKCSLTGTLDALGPKKLDENARFWHEVSGSFSLQGIRVRDGERLSAPALVKRFAPAQLVEAWGLQRKALRYPDTATVAAALWLERAGIAPEEHEGWNGRWLFDPAGAADDAPPADLAARIRSGAPNTCPRYYAVLALDGDHMGSWLKGDRAPPIRRCYHPSLARYFDSLGTDAAGQLNHPRPLTPAFSAALSTALGNFSAHVAPAIVAGHHGVLVYSGGDDVLALLPVGTALSCARDLRSAFTGEPGGNGGARQGYYRVGDRDLMMLDGASASVGIAIVHHMDDLRLAMASARDAEANAKACGRNAVSLKLVRRSGEETDASFGWELVECVERLAAEFAQGVSDRWAYRLRARLAEVDDAALPAGAAEALLRHAIARAEEGTRLRLWGETGDGVLGQAWRSWQGQSKFGGLASFLGLVMAASFLARVQAGHDQ